MRSTNHPLCSAVVLAAALLVANRAEAATRAVPSSAYPTIQSAIDAAASGDTITLVPGPTYWEALVIPGKTLTITKEPFRSGTVRIAVFGTSAPVVRFASTSARLTLSNVELWYGNTGIRGSSTTSNGIVPYLTLTNVSIQSPSGSGIWGHMNLKANNVDVDQAAGDGVLVIGHADLVNVDVHEAEGMGIAVWYAANVSTTLPSGFIKRIVDSEISDNGGEGIYISRGAFYSIARNDIHDNTRANVRVQLSSGINLTGNTIEFAGSRDGSLGFGILTIDSANTRIDSGRLTYNSVNLGSFGCWISGFDNNVSVSNLELLSPGTAIDDWQGYDYMNEGKDSCWPDIEDDGNIGCWHAWNSTWYPHRCRLAPTYPPRIPPAPAPPAIPDGLLGG